MLHAVILATALGNRNPPLASTPLAITRCLQTMDGALFNGDPSDRNAMKRDVATCHAARRAAERIAVGAEHGPAKLFVVARLLDRAAILTFMGLNEAAAALREAREANIYFRIAAALPGQSVEYRAAAQTNAELTGMQIATLQTEIAQQKRPSAVAAAQLR